MKTKFIKGITLFTLLAFTLPSLASEIILKRNFKTPVFNSISVSYGWDVILTQGNVFSVRAEAKEKYMNNLQLEVKGNTLYIKDKKSKAFKFSFWNIRNSTDNYKRVYVTLPYLTSITAGGGSDVSAATDFKVNNIRLSFSGGSDLKKFTLTCNEFDCIQSGGSDVDVEFLGVNKINVSASGGSDVFLKNIGARDVSLILSGGSDAKLDGKTDFLSISSSGGSDVKAFDLFANVCDSKFSGASDGTLSIGTELRVTVSGASDVQYRGKNVAVRKSVDNSSSVTHV